jgi:hypothetical protein
VYTVYASIVDPRGRSANYLFYLAEGSLTISKASLVIQPANATAIYGDPMPIITGTLVGKIASDNITGSYGLGTNINGVLAAQGASIGNYQTVYVPVTGGFGWNPATGLIDPDARLGNYTVTTNTGTLAIGKRTITFIANNQTVPYGTPTSTLTGSRANIYPPDDVLNGGPIGTIYTTTGTDPGTYAVVPTPTDSANRLANYTTFYQPGVLTITKADIIIPATWNPTAFPATYAATWTTSQLNVQNYITLPGPAGLGAITYTSGGQTITTSSYVLAVPTVDLTVTIAATTQYNAATATRTVPVNPGSPTLNWSIPSALVYGQTLTSTYILNAQFNALPSGAVSPGTIYYNLPYGYVVGVNSATDFGADTGTGAHYIRAFTLDNLPYYNGIIVQKSVTVSAGAVVLSQLQDANVPLGYTTLTLSGKASVNDTTDFRTAGGTPYGTIRILKLDGTQLYTSGSRTLNAAAAGIFSTPAAISLADTNYWPAGSYIIEYKYNRNSNSQTTGDVTDSTKRLVIGKIVPILANVTSGTINYGNSSVVLQGDITAGTTPAIIGSGAVVINIWTNQSRAYPPISSIATIDVNKHFSVTVPLPAGPVPFPLSVDGSPYLIEYYYTPTPPNDIMFTQSATNSAALIVNKVPLEITPTASATVVYGGASGTIVPPLSAAITVNSALATIDGITATATTTRSTTSSVGNYGIAATINDPNARINNYSVSLKTGVLQVTPATLTIKADNKTHPINSPTMPTLTKSYSGFVNNEGSSVLISDATLRTDATLTSPQGTYTIFVEGGSAGNYTINRQNGVFTVGPAGAEVIFGSPAQITYGTPMSTSQLSAYGTVAGVRDDANLPITYFSRKSDTNTAGYFPLPLGQILSAGSYTISAVCTPNPIVYPGYVTVSNNVDMTVAKAPLAIQIGANPNGNAVFGVTNGTIGGSFTPGLTVIKQAWLKVSDVSKFRIYGFQNGEGEGIFTGAPASQTLVFYLTNGPAGAPVILPNPASSPANDLIGATLGTYGISAYGYSASNYTVSVIEGSVQVVTNDPYWIWLPPQINYGQPLRDNVSWLKLRRVGTNITAWKSDDGLNYAQVSQNVFTNLGTLDTLYVGIYACEGSAANAPLTAVSGHYTMAQFDKLNIWGTANPTLTSGPIGAGYSSSVIQSPYTQDQANMYTLYSTNSWDVAMRPGSASFYYKAVTGDSEIVVRVLAQKVTAGAAGDNDAGLMIRDSLDPLAAQVAYLAVTPTKGLDYGFITKSADSIPLYNITTPPDFGTTPVVALSARAYMPTNISSPLIQIPLAGTYVYSSPSGYAPATNGAIINATEPGSVPIIVTFTPWTNVFTTKTWETYLVVNKAPLTVNVDSTMYTSAYSTRNYGSSNPVWPTNLFPVITGFVLNDTRDSLQCFIGSDAAANSQANQSYPITLRGLSGVNNYKITYVGTGGNPSLFVQKIGLNVSTPSVARAYGSDNPNFPAMLTGLALIDNGLVTATYSCAAVNTSPLGAYPLTANVTSSSGVLVNYNVSVDGSSILTVVPAPLTLRADNKVMKINGTAPTYTYTYSGFVLTDTAATPGVIIVPPTITPPVVSNPGIPGSYTIAIGNAVAPNYNITYVPGTLTVSANRAPTPHNDVVIRTAPAADKNLVIKVRIDKLLANDNDPDGDALSLISYTQPTKSGSTLAPDTFPNSPYLIYTTTGGTANDSFTYTITDGSATATATVTIVTVISSGVEVPNNTVSAAFNTDGSYTMKFIGISGFKYKLQYTTVFPVTSISDWVDMADPGGAYAGIYPGGTTYVMIADGSGFVTFTDVNASSFGNRFYRGVYVP